MVAPPPLPLAGYTAVDELIVTTPLIVAMSSSVADVARQMTETGSPYAVVRAPDGRYGVITDVFTEHAHLLVPACSEEP